MSATPLVPARMAFAPDGTPWSQAYGDVYHSVDGGLEQAREVFLAGNGLPQRWAGRERFVVLETGFGLGLNFLATWRAWKEDPARCSRLHYVAIEKHPFSLQDLRTLHTALSGVEAQAAELHSNWPVLVPGGHRLVMAGGAVTLTLFFADIKVARELRLGADALYLDGFSPAKNADMWTPQLMRALARLCAPGATVATWSVAGSVRAALEDTGFAVEKVPGFGRKREALRGRYTGVSNSLPSSGMKSATVVGAGLAGAAVCEALCARGWEVTLLERHAAPAQEASGNHAGTFHPIVTPDDSLFARLTRAAFLLSLQKYGTLGNLRWDPCGVLQLARDEKEAASQRAALAALALPPEYAQFATREEASAHAGVPVAADGLWFPRAGWVRPASLVDSLLDSCGSRLKRSFRTEARSIDPQGITILATAGDALHPVPHARLRRVRGQVTLVPEAAFEPPHAVVLRGGMVLPPVEGRCMVGASFDLDDDDPNPRAESDAGNFRRLRNILPMGEEKELKSVESRVGFRVVAPDRLPLVGRLGGNVYGALAFGSRGLIWAALAAEVLAAELEGEPLPVEGSLAKALDPARFAARAAARSASGAGPTRRPGVRP